MWVPVIGYETLYEVSDTGKVRTSLNKITFTEYHGERRWKQRTLKPKDAWSKGKRYWCGKHVSLWKDGKSKDYLVHRIEACSFYGVPLDSSLTVNHKDGNRANNNLENLELISREENIVHGFDNGLYSFLKATTLIDDSGREYMFRSLSEASKFLGHTNSYLSNKHIKNGDDVFSSSGEHYKVAVNV